MLIERFTPAEVERFFRLHKSLMFYLNTKKTLIKNLQSPEQVSKFPEEVVELRKYLEENVTLINDFMQDNPLKLGSEEIKIIEQWRKGIYGQFFIVKYDEDITYFYHSETKKCYGVLYLTEKLENMIGPYLPVCVDAWIVPYEDRIIYDGLLCPYPVSFGGNLRKTLKSEFEEALVTYGLITSFQHEQKKISDEELLKFYMKSFDNKFRYDKEIRELVRKNNNLSKVFNFEEGKHHSRHFRRNLRDVGISGYFALHKNVIIASAQSKGELDNRIDEFISKEKRASVFVFKV